MRNLACTPGMWSTMHGKSRFERRHERQVDQQFTAKVFCQAAESVNMKLKLREPKWKASTNAEKQTDTEREREREREGGREGGREGERETKRLSTGKHEGRKRETEREREQKANWNEATARVVSVCKLCCVLRMVVGRVISRIALNL